MGAKLMLVETLSNSFLVENFSILISKFERFKLKRKKSTT